MVPKVWGYVPADLCPVFARQFEQRGQSRGGFERQQERNEEFCSRRGLGIPPKSYDLSRDEPLWTGTFVILQGKKVLGRGWSKYWPNAKDLPFPRSATEADDTLPDDAKILWRWFGTYLTAAEIISARTSDKLEKVCQ